MGMWATSGNAVARTSLPLAWTKWKWAGCGQHVTNVAQMSEIQGGSFLAKMRCSRQDLGQFRFIWFICWHVAVLMLVVQIWQTGVGRRTAILPLGMWAKLKCWVWARSQPCGCEYKSLPVLGGCSSGDKEVGGSIPAFPSPHAEVSLARHFTPQWATCTTT